MASSRIKRSVAWVRNLKPVRVYRTYSLAGGNLSAAGMSFQSLFAVFAAIWVAFAILSIYLSGNTEVRDALITFINIQIPGLIGPKGFIDPTSLYSSTTLSVTGSLALIILVWTAVNWLEYARIAMHRMFGIPRIAMSYILRKVLDFIVAFVYGVFVLAGALLSVFATSFFNNVLTLFNLSVTPGSFLDFAVRGVTMIIVLVMDTVLLGAMIRVLSGVSIPWAFLWRGALIGGVVLGLMKIAGASLLGGASRNPLFASVALFIGLLIWFNLTSRVFLLTAQWIATSMRDAGLEPKDSGWVITRDTLRLQNLRASRAARKARKQQTTAL